MGRFSHWQVPMLLHVTLTKLVGPILQPTHPYISTGSHLQKSTLLFLLRQILGASEDREWILYFRFNSINLLWFVLLLFGFGIFIVAFNLVLINVCISLVVWDAASLCIPGEPGTPYVPKLASIFWRSSCISLLNYRREFPWPVWNITGLLLSFEKDLSIKPRLASSSLPS